MHNTSIKLALLCLVSTILLGLLVSPWALGQSSTEAQDDTMHNCPQPMRWAISVWGGASGTDAGQALATCGEGAVTAAYHLDPETQAWSRWFAGRPDITTLSMLDNMQGVIAMGGVAAPVIPTPSPMPSPTQPPTGGVQVLNYTSRRTEFGSLYFYGEVENQESAEVASVNAVLTLFDGANNVVGTGDDYVEPTCLSPGERGAFSIYVSDPPDAWAKETIQVQWQPKSAWDDCYKSFSVSGVSVAPREYGGLTVRGQVKNTGGESTYLIMVTFVAYDEAGEVLVVDFTFADIDPLAPGQISPFELWVTELDTVPPSYRMIVEGYAS